MNNRVWEIVCGGMCVGGGGGGCVYNIYIYIYIYIERDIDVHVYKLYVLIVVINDVSKNFQRGSQTFSSSKN